MPIKTGCEIRCLACQKWFRAGIQFGDYKSFFTSCLIGNLQNCPYCGIMIPCNKENMRFVEDKGEGHKTYIEGKDTLYPSVSFYIPSNTATGLHAMISLSLFIGQLLIPLIFA